MFTLLFTSVLDLCGLCKCQSPNGHKLCLGTGSPQMGFSESACLFPYGDSPYGNGDCSFSRPLSHTPGAIALPKNLAAKNVSIRGSPYGNRDWHIPIWKWGIPVSIRGFKINESPFLYGDPHMETGLGTSLNGKGESLFCGWKNSAKKIEHVLRLCTWKSCLLVEKFDFLATNIRVGSQSLSCGFSKIEIFSRITPMRQEFSW